jgi:hypothetical protein
MNINVGNLSYERHEMMCSQRLSRVQDHNLTTSGFTSLRRDARRVFHVLTTSPWEVTYVMYVVYENFYSDSTSSMDSTFALGTSRPRLT